MTKLFSPDQAVTQLQANPTAAAAILARLDIEACRFVPTVDSAGQAPLVETGMTGFGQPVSGCLAFSGAEVAALHQAGKKAILVCDGHESDWERHEKPDGLIVATCTGNPDHALMNPHFLNQAASQPCVMMDSPTHPAFVLDRSSGSLVLKSRHCLEAGNTVIVDPLAGHLWAAPQVSLLPVSDCGTLLQTALKDVFASVQHPGIAFHMKMRGDIVAIENVCKRHGPKINVVGLYRSEDSLRDGLCLKYDVHTGSYRKKNNEDVMESLAQMCAGLVPDDLRYWATDAIHSDLQSNYRLVDLHGISDLLPADIADEVNTDADHQIGSKALRLRCFLYSHQLRNAFTRGGKRFVFKNQKTIIIPSVCTAEEVLIFRGVVNAATDQHAPFASHHLIRFGVMIETAEAVANIARIAPLCNTLCFGTNDLTAAFTNLSRRQLDHSDWMQERGYRGRSPFEVLVPEVSGPMTQAIRTARAVNPAVQINVCGYQIGGHNLPSQLAVLKMGVDCLTIPPTVDSVLRTQAAIIRHKAGLAPV